MMNMVLSYQYCCMTSLSPIAFSLKSSSSTNKKSSLYFGRKMHEWSITTRSSSSSSSHPLMMIEPDEKDKLDGRSLCRFYDYVNEKVVNTNTKIPEEVDNAICVGSSHGWLAYVSRLDCSVFLWSPFTTSDPLISLPPIHRSSLSSGYPGQSRRYAKRLRHIIRKIVFSSIPTSDDCIVVALSNLNTCRSIVFCKPGDKSWTFIELPSDEHFLIADIIHFKDQLFYAVSNCGRNLYAYDLADHLSSPKRYLVKTSFDLRPLSSLEEEDTESSLEEDTKRWWASRHYLVESLGDLLWVRRLSTYNIDETDPCRYREFPGKTVTFEVYRLDFSRNTWEWTVSINESDDQVLFLGTNQSLSLSARDFPSLEVDCIYFTDDSCKTHHAYPPYGFPDFGHFELGEDFVASREFKFAHHPEGFWVMRNFH